MYAITLDAEKYIKSYSDKFKTPGSIVVDSIPNETDPEKLHCYQYIDEKYVFDSDKWAAIEAKRKEQEAAREEAARINGIKQQIESMKATIASTDYQIIKCYEYALNDLELPYDVQALHEERQALRDKINVLEEELN